MVSKRGVEIKRKPGLRSPSHPSLNLETAIVRAQQFYDEERRNAANIEVAAKHWGYKSSSSGASLTIAALISFGLMSHEGTGKNRRLRLTELALRIILDKRAESPDRNKAIKAAALYPKLHTEILAKWKDLPSDDTMKHYLVFERKFNENTVDDFIRELKDTISYAKISNSDTMSESDLEESDGENMGISGQSQQTSGKHHYRMDASSKSYPINQPKGKQVGSSIPVTPTCSMSIIADGAVTQEGLDKLIAYFNLIKGSFPEKEEATNPENSSSTEEK